MLKTIIKGYRNRSLKDFTRQGSLMKSMIILIKRGLAKFLAMIFLTVLAALLFPYIVVILSSFSGLDTQIVSNLFGLSASAGTLACLYHDFPSMDDLTSDHKIKLGLFPLWENTGEELVSRKTIENHNTNPLFHFSGQDNGEENPNQGGGDQDNDPLVDSGDSENASHDQGSDMDSDSGISDVDDGHYIPELEPLALEDKATEVVEFEARPNPYTESGMTPLESPDLFDVPVINDDDSSEIKEVKQQYIERLKERENDLEEILDSIENRKQDIASGELTQRGIGKEQKHIRLLEEEAREIGNSIPYDRDELNSEVENIMSGSSSNPNNIEQSSLSVDKGESSKRARSPSDVYDQPEPKRNRVEESSQYSDDNLQQSTHEQPRSPSDDDIVSPDATKKGKTKE